MKNILVVPAEGITHYDRYALRKSWYAFRTATQGQFGKAAHILRTPFYCHEIQYYGDLPRVLGKENVFVVGAYDHAFARDDIPADTRFPSMPRTPEGTPVDAHHALARIREFDAVLLSVRCGKSGEAIRRAAIQHGVFVAIIDYFDQLEVFADPRPEIFFRGKQPGRDFNLYFKEDIPLGFATEVLRPIGPIPVRPENFPGRYPAIAERDIPVFYRGFLQGHKKQPDRRIVAETLQRRIAGSVIDNLTESPDLPLKDLWARYMRAKMAFSPSGKIWDSARHCELAMFGCAPIMPTPDIELVGPPIVDGVNAITYSRKALVDGDGAAAAREALADRVEALIGDAGRLAEMAEAWRNEVLAHHTIEARSRHIAEEIGRRL